MRILFFYFPNSFKPLFYLNKGMDNEPKLTKYNFYNSKKKKKHNLEEVFKHNSQS